MVSKILQIERFVWGIVDSNSFLLTAKEDVLNHGILIDAVDSPDLYKRIELLSSLLIVLTHSHFDHIIGLNRIRKLLPDCKVIATEQCSKNIGNRIRNLSSSASAFLTFYEQGKKKDVEIPPVICAPADNTFQDDLKFEWFGHSVELRAVYGHTSDGLIAKIDDKLFTGDTLLNIPTITRFPSGSKKRFLEEDIPLIEQMDVEMIYPGHGNPDKMEKLLSVNR